MTDLIGTGEAARLLRVAPTTIARWADEGMLRPAMTTLGGHRRFVRAQVEALAADLVDVENDYDGDAA
jgi:excisionase family DNA binding protein